MNSGYRSPGYNLSIGGVNSSRHIYGDGFDLDPVDVPLATLEGVCSANDGFLVEYESHVHCDWRDIPVDVGFFGAPSTIEPGITPPLSARLECDAFGVWRAPATVSTLNCQGPDSPSPPQASASKAVSAATQVMRM